MLQHCSVRPLAEVKDGVQYNDSCSAVLFGSIGHYRNLIVQFHLLIGSLPNKFSGSCDVVGCFGFMCHRVSADLGEVSVFGMMNSSPFKTETSQR